MGRRVVAGAVVDDQDLEPVTGQVLSAERVERELE
jgi:hypothetical protein